MLDYLAILFLFLVPISILVAGIIHQNTQIKFLKKEVRAIRNQAHIDLTEVRSNWQFDKALLSQISNICKKAR